MPDELSPMQVRAARALLAWSQSDLAKAAKVANSTVADFERAFRIPVANNADAIRAALEAEGIRFVPGGALNGRLGEPHSAASPQGGSPIRWIESADLHSWASTRQGQDGFPELVRRLLYATYGHDVRVDFPSGDGVVRPGPDGLCLVEEGRGVVPAGRSIWELTTQLRGTKGKADDDYQKYLEPDRKDLFPNSSFVFVTAQRWGEKVEWADTRKKDGRWREVIALDGEDIVQWLEKCPGPALWLAAEIGKAPPDMLRLADVWEEWSQATRIPLSRDLILAGRDEDAKTIMTWLFGPPQLLSMQAESSDEALAFLHAAITELPADYAESHTARALVVGSDEGARLLGKSMSALIIALNNQDQGLAQSLVARGHHVYLALDGHAPQTFSRQQLTRPKKAQIKEALLAMSSPQADPALVRRTDLDRGILTEKDAQKLASDSARSLTVLRRLLPPSPGKFPGWARPPLSPALRAAFLVGGWDEGHPLDRAALEALAGLPYEDITRELAPFVATMDGPLRKAGSAWKLASPRDAFILLAKFLTEADVSLYGQLLETVLTEIDRRFAMNSEERWLSSQVEIELHSYFLRRGVCETAILLSLYRDQVQQVPGVADIVDRQIASILSAADDQRWWSLRDDLLNLAEASPKAFLQALDDALGRTPLPLASLLAVEKDRFFGREHLHGLIWALEALAWSPEYLLAASDCLAHLADLDTAKRNSDGPMGALRQIFLPWFPQTSAGFEARMQVIDTLAATWPDVAWSLLLSIAPRSHDMSDMNAEPKWRDFSPAEQEPRNDVALARSSQAVLQRLIALAGSNPGRWSALVELLGNFWPDQRTMLRNALLASLDTLNDEGRDTVRKQIRLFLNRHRQFPQADWSLPEEELTPLHAAYEALEPVDPVRKVEWLFQPGAGSPTPKPYQDTDVMAFYNWADAERIAAIESLFDSGGTSAILALADRDTKPEMIGEALFGSHIDDEIKQRLIEQGVKSDRQVDWVVAQSLFVRNAYTRDRNWSLAWLNRAVTEQWDDDAIDRIVQVMRNDRETWETVDVLGPGFRDRYWRRHGGLVDGTMSDIEFAVEHLLGVDRAATAVHVLGARLQKLPAPELLIRALRAAIHREFDPDDSNEIVMFGHHVGEILKYLDSDDSVPRKAIVELEWAYFSVIQHGQRPPRHLQKALADDPAFFAHLVELIFTPTEASGVPDVNMPKERRKTMAQLAWRVLKDWEIVPGSDDRGVVDAVQLKDWVRTARSHCLASGREVVGDHQIGDILAASASDEAGVWPQRAVSEVIEATKSKELDKGIAIGVFNRRGVTVRIPDAGGNLERSEAARYRSYARKFAFTARRTSALLDSIAKGYEEDARREDERAEQNDWRYT